jgi:hypothetical protein
VRVLGLVLVPRTNPERFPLGDARGPPIADPHAPKTTARSRSHPGQDRVNDWFYSLKMGNKVPR